jgi:hypothetical protein
MTIVHSHHPVRKGWCEVDVCSPIIELSFTPHYKAMIWSLADKGIDFKEKTLI